MRSEKIDDPRTKQDAWESVVFKVYSERAEKGAEPPPLSSSTTCESVGLYLRVVTCFVLDRGPWLRRVASDESILGLHCRQQASRHRSLLHSGTTIIYGVLESSITQYGKHGSNLKTLAVCSHFPINKQK